MNGKNKMNTGGYDNFAHLAGVEKQAHYQLVRFNRGSRILIMTPHGGGIEPGTSEIVRGLAGKEFSCYCFEGVKRTGNDGLHITSTRFDEPAGVEMVAQAEVVVAVHGCGDRRAKIFIGGLDVDLAEQFIRKFQQAGFSAEPGLGKISGKSPRNICNRGKTGKGVQIEISEGLRKIMFRGLDREGRNHPTEIFEHFILAGRSVLL